LTRRPVSLFSFFKFQYIPYPLWRRNMPAWLTAISRPLLRRFFPAEADFNPPQTAEAMADYLNRWGLLNGLSESAARDVLRDQPAAAESVREDATPESYAGMVRLPAQWEPLKTVLLTWPVLYPPLWEQHAQMAEAIAPVATVTISVPNPMWANAVRLFLEKRGRIALDKLRFLHLPTDDIWVRDYGPIVSLNDSGEQVCVKAIFDPLPSYPQEQDNTMALRWAAHDEIPVKHLDLHLEGGNIWSDGAGTLILSEQVYYSNPGLTLEQLTEKLRGVFNFQKLIITPRLKREETGHVDLLVKLADARTVLISTPNVLYNSGQLRAAIDLFSRESNAAGEPYHIFQLPTPPLYINWFLYPIWRSYTNALTVNGRVLVPTFGIPEDERALAIYRQAMPNHEIIPIACAVGANGGGAVHCLTKEVHANTHPE
jgi:agmatine deiminase